MTSEKYWAIRIGKDGKVGRGKYMSYFALDDRTGLPALFQTQTQARQQRREILSYCGHKDVFAIPVELKSNQKEKCDESKTDRG